jgi:hypothetical protein
MLGSVSAQVLPAVSVLAAPPIPRRGGRAARLESEPCATSPFARFPMRYRHPPERAKIQARRCGRFALLRGLSSRRARSMIGMASNLVVLCACVM